MTKNEKIALALLKKAMELRRVIVLSLLAVSVSACASETGWRFEVGVSPVKELNNQAGIKQAPPSKERY